MHTLNETNDSISVSKALIAGETLSLAPNHFEKLDALIRKSMMPDIANEAGQVWKAFKQFLHDLNLKIIQLDITYSEGTYLYAFNFQRKNCYCSTILRVRAIAPTLAVPPEAFPQLFAVMLLAILGTMPAEQLVEFAKEG
jgi:hypothetical protein